MIYTLIPDCFTDCWVPGKSYSGIRSASKTGEVCKGWNNMNSRPVRSNICYGNQSMPSCYTKDGMNLCDVQKCSTIDYGNKDPRIWE